MYDLILTWSNNGMQYFEFLEYGMTLADCLFAARIETALADGHAIAVCEVSV